MKEEDNILRKVGVENPFQVPDGYFEHLTSEIMSRLPEKSSLGMAPKRITLWDKVKPWAYMAAMFAGAAVIIRVASTGSVQNPETVAEEDTEMEEVEFINDMLDNSMMDDYSLYVYLADIDAE